ncbi:hypothetical protein PoB_003752200 [Plakobranchus ocellatus]|uniref:Uncharacterized protein n=1 Tax=Plakobranchus ocellatus TaxID=259542 RepID=A0AAV4AUM5_9GAST|nr:hypothetical protein PoB_003752200 [Plakobranchus ocellatus]
MTCSRGAGVAAGRLETASKRRQDPTVRRGVRNTATTSGDELILPDTNWTARSLSHRLPTADVTAGRKAKMN